MINDKSKILLVDDFELVRRTLRQQLNEIGITKIDDARDGEEALEKLKQAQKLGQPFHAMFLDWNMPVKSGLDVLKECRSAPQFEHLPIIMVTMEVEVQNVLTALSLGVTDYIVKPFSPAVLRAKIKNVNDLLTKGA